MALKKNKEEPPKQDDHGFYVRLDHLNIGEGQFRTFDGDPLNRQYQPQQEILKTVIATSGYQFENYYGPPAGSGIGYLLKTVRNDRKDGHINVDNTLLWQDGKGRYWQRDFKYPSEHVQNYIDVADSGNLFNLRGIPTTSSGTISENINELGELGFNKANPPYTS
jgi:hypothetical protein